MVFFTESQAVGKEVLRKCAENLTPSVLELGGVGESGMGAYHGKTGFDAFSHHKSIVDKKTNVDLPIRYRPYNKELYKKLLKKFMK